MTWLEISLYVLPFNQPWRQKSEYFFFENVSLDVYMALYKQVSIGFKSQVCKNGFFPYFLE